MRTRIPKDILHGSPELVVKKNGIITASLNSFDAQRIVWFVDRLFNELRSETSPNERHALSELKRQLLDKKNHISLRKVTGGKDEGV